MTIKQRLHKLLALVTTFMMLFSSMPVEALAETVEKSLEQSQQRQSAPVAFYALGNDVTVEYYFKHVGAWDYPATPDFSYTLTDFTAGEVFGINSEKFTAFKQNEIFGSKRLYDDLFLDNPSASSFALDAGRSVTEITVTENADSNKLKLYYSLSGDEASVLGKLSAHKHFYDTNWNPTDTSKKFTYRVTGLGIALIGDDPKSHFWDAESVTRSGNETFVITCTVTGDRILARLPAGRYTVNEGDGQYDAYMMVPNSETEKDTPNISGPTLEARGQIGSLTLTAKKGEQATTASLPASVIIGNRAKPASLILKKTGGLAGHTFTFKVQAQTAANGTAVPSAPFAGGDMTITPSTASVAVDPANAQQLIVSGVKSDETVTIGGLPAYKYTVVEISYTYKDNNGVEHTVPINDPTSDYLGAVSGSVELTPGDNTSGIVNLANTTKEVKLSHTVNKVWLDGQTTHPSIQVQLYADDVASGSPVTLSDSTGWSYEWTGLTQNANGKPITYSANEVNVPAGYEKTVNRSSNGTTTTITNRAMTEVKVTKQWNDPIGTDHSGLSVKVQLKQNGSAYGEEVALNNDNNFTKTWSPVPAYDDNNSEYIYTVEETVRQTGYTQLTPITVNGKNDFTIVNQINEGSLSLRGTKTWVDEAGMDPTAELWLQRRHKGSSETWADQYKLATFSNSLTSYSATNLAQYDTESLTVLEWEYRVAERNCTTGYDVAYSNGKAADGQGSNTIVFVDSSAEVNVTNTFVDNGTRLTINKTWNDSGEHPTSLQVTIRSDYPNGVMSDLTTVTLTEANGWTLTYPAESANPLPVYRNANGALVKVSYTAVEASTAGYTANSGLTISQLEDKSYTASFENTRDSNDCTLSIEKHWWLPSWVGADFDSESASFTLYRTTDPNHSTTDPTLWTNAETFDLGTVTAAGKGGDSDTPCIVTSTTYPDREESTGKLYYYGVVETLNGTYFETKENTTPAKYVIGALSATTPTIVRFDNALKRPYSAEMFKTVVDTTANSAAAKAQKYHLELYYVDKLDGEHLVDYANLSDGQRSGVISTLPEGTYVVKETGLNQAWEGWTATTTEVYTPTQTLNSSKTHADFKVTNTREAVTLSAEKLWVDNKKSDIEGRPEIILSLFAKDSVTNKWLTGNFTEATGEDAVAAYSVTLDSTKANGDTWAIGSMPAYTLTGHQITYTVTEDDDIGNYVSSTKVNDTKTKTTITNTLTGSITAKKTWVDENASTRPGLTFSLIGKKGVIDTQTPNANGEVTFTNVSFADALSNGLFAIRENMTGDNAALYQQVYPDSLQPEVAIGGHQDFINELIDDGHANITFTKTWADDSNTDGKRPATLTVRLLSDYGNALNMFTTFETIVINPTTDDVKTITFPAAANDIHVDAWAGAGKLPRYTYVNPSNKAEGLRLVNYKVQEVVPGDDYTPNVPVETNGNEKTATVVVDSTNATAITNTLVGGKGDITANKQWNVPWYLSDTLAGLSANVTLWRKVGAGLTLPADKAAAQAAGWELMGAEAGVTYPIQFNDQNADTAKSGTAAVWTACDTKAPNGTAYTYALIETFDAGDYADSFTSSAKVVRAVPGSSYTFVNSYDRIGSLTISKHIEGIAGENYNGCTFEYTLKYGTKIVASGLIGPGATPASVTLPGLAANVEYTLTETNPGPAWKQDAGNPWLQTFTLAAGSTTEKVITNVRDVIPQRTLTKEWVDDGSAARPTATFKLYAQIGNTNTYLTQGFDTQEADALADAPVFRYAYANGANATENPAFTNLPKYTLDGTQINYTVVEAPLSGYDQVQDGDTFTNTKQVGVSVQKQWNDKGGNVTDRPVLSFTLTGNSNGFTQTVDLAANTAANTPDETNTVTFTNVKYDPAGYTVTEAVKGANPAGYEADVTTVTLLANGCVDEAGTKGLFTNTRTKATLTVTKTIVDNTQDKTAGNATTYSFVLKQGDVTVTSDPIGNGETVTYNLLLTIDQPYTLSEVANAGYALDGVWDTAFEGNRPVQNLTDKGAEATFSVNADQAAITVTNTRLTVKPSVTKVWVDNSNAATTRPEQIVFVPQAQDSNGSWRTVNGYSFTDSAVPAIGSSKDYSNIQFVGGDLAAKQLGGTAFTYRVVEQGADDEGKTTINGKNDAVYDSSVSEDGKVITNKLQAGQIQVKITKTWLDGNGDPLADEKHPEELPVVLNYATAASNKNVNVTLKAKDETPWQWIDTTLPRFDDNGEQYVYTVTENGKTTGDVTLDGNLYTVQVSKKSDNRHGFAFGITNTRKNDNPTKPTKTPTYTQVSIIKDDQPAVAVKPGTEYTYTIAYYNHNNTPATVTIHDDLDARLTYVKSEASVGTISVAPAAGAQVCDWTIVNVPPFTQAALTLTVKVAAQSAFTEDGTPVIENSATLKVGGTSESATSPDVNVYNPKLKATKQAIGKKMADGSYVTYDYYTEGEVVGYTVTIENVGNVAVSNINVFDDHFKPAGSSVPLSETATLEPGRSATITYDYTITAADVAATSVTNTVYGKGKGTEGDDVKSNDAKATIPTAEKGILSIRVEDVSYVWDGQPHSGYDLPRTPEGQPMNLTNVSTATYTISGLKADEGHYVVVNYTPQTGTDAGFYGDGAFGSITIYSGDKVVNDQYDMPTLANGRLDPGSLTITRPTATITLSKTWVDGSNRDELRPATAEDGFMVRLQPDAAESDANADKIGRIETIHIARDAWVDTDLNSWNVVLKDVVTNTGVGAGTEITYTIIEEFTNSAKYTQQPNPATITPANENSASLTNTLKQTIQVEKVWQDKGGLVSERPVVTFTAVGNSDSSKTASATLTANTAADADKTTYTIDIENLLYDPDGYTITETIGSTNVGGYTLTTANGVAVDANGKTEAGANAGFTNTRSNATLTVTKTIVDASQDSAAGLATKYQFSIDNGATKSAAIGNGAAEKVTFPVTIGTEYTLSEFATGTNVLSGVWSTAFAGNDAVTVDAATGTFTVSGEGAAINVTNTRLYEDVSFKKVWQDEDNANGTRPDTITVVPQVRVGDSDTWATVSGYSKQFAVTNTSEDYGPFTFAQGQLADKALDGAELTYRVAENTATIPGENGGVYDSEVEGGVITNTLQQGEVDVTITKEWLDESGNAIAEGLHPENVTVTLTWTSAGGAAETGSHSGIVLSRDGGWAWNSEDVEDLTLPRFDSKGNLYVYAVTENGLTDGKFTSGGIEYTVTVTDPARNNYAFTVTNVRGDEPGTDPEKTAAIESPITVNTPDGKQMVERGGKITYTIAFRNYTAETATVVVKDNLPAVVTRIAADDKITVGGVVRTDVTYANGAWTITNVPSFTNGSVQLTVTVNENAFTNNGVNNDGTPVITNTADLTVGGEDTLHSQPVTETVYNPKLVLDKALLGIAVDGGYLERNAAGTGYAEGETVYYTVTVTNKGDVPVKDITVTDTFATADAIADIAGGSLVNGKLVPTSGELGLNESCTITYAHTITAAEAADASGKLTNIAVANGVPVMDKPRTVESNPDDVTINVGSKIPLTITVLDATYEWTGDTLYGYTLPIDSLFTTGSDAGKAGLPTANDKVNFTVAGNLADGHKIKVSGYTVASGINAGVYPNANGLPVANVSVWDGDNDVTALYGIVTVPGKLTITRERKTVTLTKKWEDDSNRDGLRPAIEAFIVTLEPEADQLSSDTVLGEIKNVTVNNWAATADANVWTAEVADIVTRNSAGEALVYTFNEGAIEGYTQTPNPAAFTPATAGLTVTNTHTPDTVTLNVTKVWADDNNKDGLRPAQVEVGLYNGDSLVTSELVGAETAAKTLNAANSWTATWTVKKNQRVGDTTAEIAYSVLEHGLNADGTLPTADAGRSYTVSYSDNGTEAALPTAFTVTNTHLSDVVSVEVNKQWLNGAPTDPNAKIVVTLEGKTADGHLYVPSAAHGEPALTAELTAANGWSYIWNNLPKFEKADPFAAYVWTVTEVSGPDGWTALDEGIVPALPTEDGAYDAQLVNERDVHASLVGTKLWTVPAYVFPTDMEITLQLERSINGTDWEPATQLIKDGDGNGVAFAAETITYEGSDTTFSVEWNNVATHDLNSNEYSYRIRETFTNAATGAKFDVYANGTLITAGDLAAAIVDGEATLENRYKTANVVLEKQVTDWVPSHESDYDEDLMIPAEDTYTFDLSFVEGEYSNLAQTLSITTAADENGAIAGQTTVNVGIGDYNLTETNYDANLWSSDSEIDFTVPASGNVVFQNVRKTITYTLAKDWNDTEADAASRPAITYILTGKVGQTVVYENTIPYEGVTINVTLPFATPAGEEITWSAEEAMTPEGLYNQTNKVSDAYSTTFTNTKAGMQVVEKQWATIDGFQFPVTVEVNRKSDSGVDKGFTRTVTLAAPTWKAELSGVEDFDANGKPYTYFIVKGSEHALNAEDEARLKLYTVSYPADLVIKNTLIDPADLTIRGEKTWIDLGTHKAITVTLQRRHLGSTDDWADVDSKTFEAAAADWTYSWTDLPHYDVQTTEAFYLEYRIVESAVSGYTTTYDPATPVVDTKDGFANEAKTEVIDITNELDQVNDVTVSYKKIWKDNALSNKRPASITVQLYANAAFDEAKGVWVANADEAAMVMIDSKPLPGSDADQADSFEDLPRYANVYTDGVLTGKRMITYQIREDLSDTSMWGLSRYYDCEDPDGIATPPADNLYGHGEHTLTNTRKPVIVSVEIDKNWYLPTNSLTQAELDAIAVDFTMERSLDGVNWEHAIDANGNPVSINTFKPNFTSPIYVQSDGVTQYRTSSIQATRVPLHNEDGIPYMYRITEETEDNSRYTSSCGPYPGSADIVDGRTYTFTEEEYLRVSFGDHNYSTDFFNRMKVASVAVTKQANKLGNEDEDNLKTFTMNIARTDGSYTASKAIKHGETWNLGKLPAGSYTITETGADANVWVDNNSSWSAAFTVDGQGNVTSTSENLVISEDGVATFTVINDRVVKELTLSKVWHGTADQPADTDVTFELIGKAGDKWLASDYTLSDTEATFQTKPLAADDTVSFTDVPKADVDGTAIVYTIRETIGGETVYEGVYTDGWNWADEAKTVENYETISLTVTKNWVTLDGNHPDNVTVTLYANGERAKSIVNHTLTDVADATFASSVTFTDLPRYDANDQLITYTVVEKAIDGYDTQYWNGADLTTDEAAFVGTTPVAITNAIKQTAHDDVNVRKAWIDAAETQSLRSTITAQLHSNEGVLNQTAKPAVTKVAELPLAAATWTNTFEDLNTYGYLYDANGVKTGVYQITYEVYEDLTTVPAAYQADNGGKAVYDEANDEYVVTNRIRAGKDSITVVKSWDMPDYVKDVTYNASVFELQRTKTPSIDTSWAAIDGYDALTLAFSKAGATDAWENLPSNDSTDGKKWYYRVVETATDDAFTLCDPVRVDTLPGTATFVNVIKKNAAPINVTKTMTDLNEVVDRKHTVPFTFNLYRVDEVNGANVETFLQTVTISLKLTSGSSVTSDPTAFDLTQYVGGLAVGNYVIREVFSPAALGDIWTTEPAAREYAITVTEDGSAQTKVFTNKHVGTTHTVTKVWEDDDDAVRHDLTINVYAKVNGNYISSDFEATEGQQVFITKTYTVDGSPVTFNLPTHTVNGEAITYEYEEVPVDPDYIYNGDVTVTGDNATFTNTPNRVDITVTKVWNDNGGDASGRPTVTFELYEVGHDDAPVRTMTLPADATAASQFGDFLDVADHIDGWYIREVLTQVNGNAYAPDEWTKEVVEDKDGNGTATFTNTRIRNVKSTPDITEIGIVNGEDTAMVKDGETFAYRITYMNHLTETATVTVSDTLPVGVDFVSADNGGVYDAATRNITWTIENVVSLGGGSVSVTVKANLAALTGNDETEPDVANPELHNTANVNVGGSYDAETNPVDKTLYNPAVDVKKAALGLYTGSVDGEGKPVFEGVPAYNASRKVFTAGEYIVYSIVITNTGNVALKNVTLEDTRLAENNSFGTLAVGETVTYYYTYLVTESDVTDGKITNTAVVTGTPDTEEPQPDVTDEDSVTVLTGEGVVLTAASKQKIYNGQPLYWNGADTETNAAGTWLKLTDLDADGKPYFTVSGGLLPGDWAEVQINGSVTHVSEGVVDNVITDYVIYRKGADGNNVDVTDAYNILTATGDLEILKRDVTIIADSDQCTYDELQALPNKTLTDPDYAVLDGNFAQAPAGTAFDGETAIIEGETISATITGAISLIGTEDNVPSDAAVDGGLLTDYQFHYINGLLEVTGDPGKIEKDDTKVDYQYNFGETIEYRITFTNRGEETMTDIVITETTGNAMTALSGAVGTISADGLTCTIPELAGGSTVVITAEHTVTAQDVTAETYENRVEFDATYPNRDLHDEANKIVEVKRAHLDVTKVSDKGEEGSKQSVRPGETITYTVKVVNLKNSVPGENDAVAESVTVEEQLPTAYVTFVSASATKGAYDEESGIWTVGDMDVGEEQTLTLTVIVKDDKDADNNYLIANGQKVVNRVVAHSPTDPDPDGGETTDTVEYPELKVIKDIASPANGASVRTGDTVSYTITLTNSGRKEATAIEMKDQLPEGLTDVKLDGVSVTLDSSRSFFWTVDTLAPDTTVTFTVTAVVAKKDVDGAIGKNWVFVTEEGGTPTDPDDPDTRDDTPEIPVKNPDLKILKDVDKTLVYYTQEVTYTITVANNGAADAVNVKVEDTLPDGLVLAEEDPISVTGDVTWDASAAPALVFTIGTLAPGATATINITVKVMKKGPGEVDRNVATITEENDKPTDPDDPDLTDDTPPIKVRCVTVTFVDWDGTVLKKVQLNIGDSTFPPPDPSRPLWDFWFWDGVWTNVQKDEIVWARYTPRYPEEPPHYGIIIDGEIPLAGGYMTTVGDCFD